MGDMGMGMTMMGAPTVFGTNQDSNNFLDVRNMRHSNDQGTIRVDRVFDEANTLSVRYSISKEDGFMPQNLPGFGFNHDNQSQNASVIYTRVLSPNLVNTASLAVSRLAMSHFAENNNTNDIVGQLGITGVGLRRPAPDGALPTSMCRAIRLSAIPGWPLRCRPGTPSWRRRDTLSWQKGRHALKFGAQRPLVYLADVGAGAEPRLLFVHVRLYHADRDQRRHGLRAGQLSARTAGRAGSFRTACPA